MAGAPPPTHTTHTHTHTRCPARVAEDLGSASEDSSSVGISWDNRSAYCMNLDDDPAAQEAAFRAGVYQDFDCVFSVNQGGPCGRERPAGTAPPLQAQHRRRGGVAGAGLCA
jgi:hypothetical protein